jgi:hypothetical protein
MYGEVELRGCQLEVVGDEFDFLVKRDRSCGNGLSSLILLCICKDLSCSSHLWSKIMSRC